MNDTAILTLIRFSEDHYSFSLEMPAGSSKLGHQQWQAPARLYRELQVASDVRFQLNAAFNNVIKALRTRYLAAEDDALGTMGRLLYTLFLPDTMQQAIALLDQKTALVIATNDFTMPWELLHDGRDFLMLQRPLARQMLTTAPIRRDAGKLPEERSVLMLFNPTGDLQETEVEAETLMTLYTRIPEITPKRKGNRRASTIAVLQALASNAYELIHYSGHTAPDALLLADGKFSADDIQTNLRGHPFVFLNSCRSAQQARTQLEDEWRLVNQGATGLAGAFLQGGACGLIGTLWPVPETSSRAFAERFYALAFDGKSVGEALLAARQHMYSEKPADPLWASYVLYGDPNHQLITTTRQEIRRATVLVARLSNLSTLFTDWGLERTAHLKSAIIALLAQTAAGLGGEIHSILGDLICIRFGFPLIYEDDTQRAIRSALALQQALANFLHKQAVNPARPPALHVGVATGRVIVQQVTTNQRIGYQFIGNLIERAVVLAGHAAIGEVLVDEASRYIGEQHFTFAVCNRVVSHNDLLPDALFCVTGLNLTSVEQDAFFGRDAELAALNGWWREVQNGRGRILNLYGAAGVGKSRLVQAFKEQLAFTPHQWIAASCQSYEQESAYRLLSQIIAALVGIAAEEEEAVRKLKLETHLRLAIQNLNANDDSLLSESMALLGPLLTLDCSNPKIDHLKPELRQKRVADLLWHLLDYHADQQPLILLLDDLQRADESSLAVINLVIGKIAQLPIFVLLLHRLEWAYNWTPQAHYRSLVLEELPDAERQEFLLQRVGSNLLPPELIQAILTRTGGNALFIKEVVRSLQEDRVLVQTENGWALAVNREAVTIPDTLENLISVRLAQLEPHTRETLKNAAVIGSEFDPQVLQSVQNNVTPEHLDDELNELNQRNLVYKLRRSKAYAFSHSLVHQATYANLVESVRRRLHRLVAWSLQRLYGDDKSSDLLAYHYYRSDDRVSAVHYALKAAKRAAEHWSNTMALEWYDRILEKIDSLNTKAPNAIEQEANVTSLMLLQWQMEALQGKGDVQASISHYDDAIRTYRAVFALAEQIVDFPANKLAGLQYKIGSAFQHKGDFDQAKIALAEGLHLVGSVRCVEAGLLQVWTGFIHFKQGELEQGLDDCNRGITILEQMQSEQDLAQAYNLRGLLHHDAGQVPEAFASFAQSIKTYEQAAYLPGQVRAYNNRVVLYQDLGRWKDALHDLAQAVQLAGRTGEAWWQAGSLINQAEIYRYQGEIAQAVAANQAALQIAAEHDLAELVGLAQMNLGACALKIGELSAAAEKLGIAMTIFTEHSSEHLAEAQGHLAELQTQQNQPELALALAQTARAKCQEAIQIGRLHRVLGRACRQLQRLDEARDHLDKSMAAFQTRNFRYELALTWLELALLYQTLARTTGDADGSLRQFAIQCCEHAITSFTELGAKLDLAYALEIYQSM